MSAIVQLAYETAAKDAAWPVLPIVIADIRNGEIYYISKFCADIFGYDVSDLLGQPLEMLLPEDVRSAHIRWRQDASVPKTRLMGVGRTIRGRRKTGETFPVHVGLTTTNVMGLTLGIGFVIDLTGIVALAELPSAKQDQGR